MAKFQYLYWAVLLQDHVRLRQLVREGIDINCRDSRKATVLHHAAAHLSIDGMKAVIKTLVDLGADINAGDIRRRTPLHYYVQSVVANTVDVAASAIAFLISLGANINAKYDTITSLDRAIQLQNIRGIETLVRLGVDVNKDKERNTTALHLVLYMTWMTLLEHLVKCGADTNAVGTSLPPLHQAVELGRLDIVKLLVQYGADVNARKLDVTPVLLAVVEGIPHVLKSLCQLGADLNAKLSSSSVVNEIVKVGRVDILEYLVRHGADTLHPGFEQNTALGLAVSQDRHEMVECLLENGADFNVRYDSVSSPYMTAMRLGDTDMVRALAKLAPMPIDDEDFCFSYNTILQNMERFNDLYEAVEARDCARLRQLVRRGIDINCRDSWKRTVLHHATAILWTCGMKDVIRTLVDLGADINACDIERVTPLNNFLFKQSVVANADATASAIAFLISLGADINATFDARVTSLHRAIRLKNIRGIETLLRLGVDVNEDKWLNITTLHLALDTTWTTLLDYLVKFGADTDSVGTSLPPLLQAVELGRFDIVKLLVQYGADVNARRNDVTPVVSATARETPHVLESLSQLGADLNAKLSSSSSLNEIVKIGKVDILEYLLRHGADLMSPGFKQFTALEKAISNDLDEKVVDCLLKNGADVNVRYDQTLSPFVTAMRLGDTDMVRALAKLAPYPIDDDRYFSIKNYTVLHKACHKDPNILELLLKHGGDVNLKCDRKVPLVHQAVALSDGNMLQVLAKLGANLNNTGQRECLICHILSAVSPKKAERQMAFIKVLVEAGLDLNRGHTEHVTPLHDAVRLGDLSMVQMLVELEVDVLETKSEVTPLSSVISSSRTDLVRYFAEIGIDVNRTITTGVNPLHDAVRKGDVEMVRILNAHGANIDSQKNIQTALAYAMTARNNDMVKCLLEYGADINAKSCFKISALHDAVEKSNLGIIDVLTDCRLPDNTDMQDQVTPLGHSIQFDHPDLIETLLKHGADMNCVQHTHMTPLDVALDQGKLECALLLKRRNVKANRDTIGSSPLHLACRFGHTDLARLLIIVRNDVNKLNIFGNKPMECLQLSNIFDYHVLQETVMAAKVAEQVPTSAVSTSGCQNMKTSLHTRGIGDVKYISGPFVAKISQDVYQFLASAIQQCKAFPGNKLIPVGSSAEGTRVGLPNEMDFLFLVQVANTSVDLKNGYAEYDFLIETFKMSQQTTNSHSISLSDRSAFPKECSGSADFHAYFIEEVMNKVFSNLRNTSYDSSVLFQVARGSIGIKDTDRKACSPLRLCWHDGGIVFYISVDIVPSVHIDNWPEGATTRTWLMGEKQLRSRGYVLVPKPPHAKSDLAKKCTEEELITLWKISFPHLETEHMQRLEQRVKDVFITAKCLRNPEVCRIMITDEGSLPRTVSKYITSYQLKMCFFKNVEYFLQHEDLCLEEMVCKVYDDLVLGLSQNFIPLFFLPKVSALSGINMDVPKSFKVANIMARFVRALYLRDSLIDIVDGGDDLVMTVYQRNTCSVYRVYNISKEDV